MTSQDWPRLPIGLIAKPRLGGNYKNGPSATVRPLVKMGNIARVSMDVSRIEYIPDGEKVLEEHRLHFGDVLFNTRNTLDLVGKVSIWRDELPVAYYNSNILRLEFDVRYCGTPEYFGYVLNTAESIDAIRGLATGTTSVAAVYTRDLLKLTVPVPDAAEQRAIAQALRDVDALTSSLTKLIAKKRAIKQGMMQELLTGRTRLPGFAGGWTPVIFGDIATPSKDRSDPRTTSGRVVELEHISARTGHLLGDSDLASSVSLKTRFLRGDVLFGKLRAYLRKYWLADRDGFASTEIWALRPRTGVATSAFLRYVVEQDDFIEVASTAYGTHMPRSDWKVVSRYELELPTLDEQAAIGLALQSSDDEIAALERRLEATRAIKQGMMQELLTGRTRLAPAEASA